MFKVGDVVERIDGADHLGKGMLLGNKYTVTSAYAHGVFFKESVGSWDPDYFKKVDVPSALTVQVGGVHYKSLKIQPVEFIMANGISFMEGNVIKYVTRWKDKGGVADLKKAKHYIEMLIENEEKNASNTN